MKIYLGFAVSDTRNCGHGSDSPQEVDREIVVFEPFMKNIGDPMKLFELPKELQPTDLESEPDAEFCNNLNGQTKSELFTSTALK